MMCVWLGGGGVGWLVDLYNDDVFCLFSMIVMMRLTKVICV